MNLEKDSQEDNLYKELKYKGNNLSRFFSF